MEVPVVSQWAPPTRFKASLGTTVGATVLVLVAVAAWALQLAPGPLFVPALLGLLAVLLVFQALVVVTGIKQQPLAAEAAGGAAAWEPPAEGAGPGPMPGPIPAAEPVTLKCGACATVFDIHDTGERPLRHTCPGCGAQGELTEAELGPPPAAPSTSGRGWAAPAPPETITLKCGSCATVFDVTDSGARPLAHTCPGCGAQGELSEAELGPPPAAEAPAMPEPPAAPAPAGPAKAGTKVRNLKLRCKNCSTVFTLRDTGERPLYHECPGCKATGVLR